MKRTVEEYMKLPYTIEITPDDGSFFIKVKELPGCMSVGETRSETMEMIDDAMRGWLEVALEDGIEIPLPEIMQEEKYSGKFALRLPKSLHTKLAEAAEREGVSLNQYIITLLSENSPLHEIRGLLKKLPEESRGREQEVISTISEKRPNCRIVSMFDRKAVKLAGAL